MTKLSKKVKLMKLNKMDQNQTKIISFKRVFVSFLVDTWHDFEHCNLILMTFKKQKTLLHFRS